MTVKNGCRRGFVLVGVLAVLFWQSSLFAAVTNVYFTQFEAAQGYNLNLNLSGQNGWVSSGSGGNRLTDNSFPGMGWQAYIGLLPPNQGGLFLSLWRPINFTPTIPQTALVKFSVSMAIFDSDNNRYDDFYWSVYNSQGDRLFTIDFDNFDLSVYYALDGTNQFVPTGKFFTNDVLYNFEITMDFLQKTWSAKLGANVLVTNKPMTTVGAPLNLGDVDAVWSVRTVNAAGDNCMVFDNYKITAEPASVPPASLSVAAKISNGPSLLRVSGQSGFKYAVDASTDLVSWVALKTNVISDSYFDYVDSGAAAMSRRYYRARLVP